MKAFNTPVIEIEKWNIADVITTSGEGETTPTVDPGCPNNVCPDD